MGEKGGKNLYCFGSNGGPNGFDADGGVHGAIIQAQSIGSILPAGSGTPFAAATAWARLLYQSVTAGDAVTLHMEIPF